MKKINIFYLILVGLAIAMTVTVLLRDMKDASMVKPDHGEEPSMQISEDGTPVKVVYRVDTVYVTEVVHDTVYIEKGAQGASTPVDRFLLRIRQVLKEELGPFYKEYKVLTEDNIEEAKARFEECEKKAKKRYDPIVADFIKDYPEELDYINNLVSKELTNAIKPYLHMLNEYGNRK